MKKNLFTLLILLSSCTFALAQFAGIQQRGIQDEPMPESFKPASTNTFLSQYAAVNPMILRHVCLSSKIAFDQYTLISGQF